LDYFERDWVEFGLGWFGWMGGQTNLYVLLRSFGN